MDARRRFKLQKHRWNDNHWLKATRIFLLLSYLSYNLKSVDNVATLTSSWLMFRPVFVGGYRIMMCSEECRDAVKLAPEASGLI